MLGLPRDLLGFPLEKDYLKELIATITLNLTYPG